MTALWTQNVVAHWLQASVLVAGAAAVAALLRLRHPAVRVVLWQAVLALIVVLPFLQPWHPTMSSASTGAAAAPGVTAAIATAGGNLTTGAQWPIAILAMVAAGVVLRLGWIGLGLTRVARLRALPPLEAGSLDEIHAVMRSVGVRAAIRIAAGIGPFSFGIRRPVIVLPEVVRALSRDKRLAIALHEAIHVRRRDWAYALAEELALALLWFHPWAWWVRAQIRLAREQAVDRETVARLGARDAYARCLLTMAGYDAAGTTPVVALLRRRELRHRLEALFQEVTMSSARLAATVAVLGAVLTGAAAAAAAAFPLTAAAGARRVVHLVPPDYPTEVQSAGVTGTVTLEVAVDPRGTVTTVDVTGGPAQLRGGSAAAVRQWKFESGAASELVVVEVGYDLQSRDGEQVPSWSFTVRRGGPMIAPLRVGGDVIAPKVKNEVAAVYPAAAKAAGVEGSIVLEAIIGVDGRVTDVKVVRSVPELDAAAVEAVRQWEFEPGTRRGAPVAVLVQIEVTFTLK